MKYLKCIKKLWFLHLLFTILMAAAIICLGTKLTYNNNAFLQDWRVRIALVALLITIWVLAHLQIDLKQSQISENTKEQQDLDVKTSRSLLQDKQMQPLTIWRQQFPEAANLSILLISGYKNAVTAIRSQLGASLTEVHTGEEQFPIRWALYQNLILIELDQKLPLSAWVELLESLKSEWRRMLGLVYAISAPQLLNIKAAHNKLEQQKLAEFVRRLPKALPVYLTVAQLEELPGFKEFFAGIYANSQTQCFGFNIQSEHHDYLEKLRWEIKSQISIFCLGRLQKLARSGPGLSALKLYFFPNHFEKLTKSLIDWVNNLHLYNANEPLINMVFFNALLPHTKLHAFSTLSLLEFIKNSQITKSDSAWVQNSKIKLTRCIWLLGVIIYLSLLSIWCNSYVTEKHLLASFAQDLQHENINHAMVNHWQQQLLRQSFWANAGLIINKDLLNNFAALDQQLLMQELSAQLQTWFQKNLVSEADLPLYEDFRAYLMLGSLTHRNVNQLVTWFLLHQNEFSFDLAKFTRYLNHDQTINLDNELVANSRERLQRLSGLELAYEYLKAHTESTDQVFALVSNELLTQVPVFTNLNPSIPGLYTKAWLSKNYSNIKNVVTEQSSDNWVIGEGKYINNEMMTQDLLQLYLNNYSHYWQKRVLFLKIVQLHDLNQAIQVLTVITGDHSIFGVLLDNFYENTHFNNTDILPVATYLNKMFASYNVSQQDFSAVKVNLIALDQELTQLVNQPSENHAVLTLVLQHFSGANNDALSHLAAQINSMHSPLKEWLQSLYTQIWQLILTEARKELGMLWQQQVFSIYESTLANHYPLQSSATNEVSLADFNAFLAPDGILNKFYQKYLQVLLNGGDTLSNKIVDGYSFGFSDTFLHELEAVKRLQNTFFATGKATAAIIFTIEPWDLSADLAQVKLSIGPEVISYNHGPLQNYKISWPDNATTLGICWQGLQAEQKASKNYQGVWAIFHLFQNAQQNISKDGLLITIKQDIGYISYMVKADTSINPFGLHNLEINLPEQLY